MKKYWILIIVILSLFFITGCEAEIGEDCGNTGLFNISCVTGNCYNGTCYSNYEGGYCKEEYHCVKSYCINNICSQKSELNGPCEYYYHCNEGICKEGSCQLGEKGDKCSKKEDCNKGFECSENKCISSEWYCKIARFLGLGPGTIILSIFFLALGFLGARFGLNIMGGQITLFGIITFAISIIVIGAALGVIGIGLFSVCY